MKRVDVDLLALTREAIVEHLAPRGIVDTILEYGHGRCAIFAAALAEKHGLSEVVAVYEKDYFHYAVRYRDALLDAYGVTTLKKINARYHKNGQALLMPRAVLLARLLFNEQDYVRARQAVDVLTKFHRV